VSETNKTNIGAKVTTFDIYDDLRLFFYIHGKNDFAEI